MTLNYSMRKYLLNVKVGIFSLSYAVVPSFLASVLLIDPYFTVKFIFLVIHI